MKICVLGDCHIGMRGDSVHFHNLYAQFYNNLFFPYLKENNISTIFQLGDLFDRRKFINFQSLHLSKRYFFDNLRDYEFHTLLGNHDVAYKNTLEVNSSQLLLDKYDNIKVYAEPVTLNFDGTSIDIIPWICRENEQQILDFISNSRSRYCFGHFEIYGFEMDKGNVCREGMDRTILSKYDMVLSGHFHHKSSDGHITYVGTPGEMTWADYGDKRGFHIFDTNTGEMEFIENPYRMFYKIIYDESQEYKEMEKYKDKIVKVIIENKKNEYLYEKFFDSLYKAFPLDVSIVEDFVDYSEITEDDVVDQAEDTITILDKYIDGLEANFDPLRLKSLMREIYNEAQNSVTV